MDEQYGTYPKTAWFNFPCGRIKLSLSNNYYRESRTSPEVKVFFVAENPDPVGFSYGLEARLKRGSFEYSFDNRKVLLDTSVSVRGTFGFAKIAFRDFQTGGTCTCEQAFLGYPTTQEGVIFGVYVPRSCIGPEGLVVATVKMAFCHLKNNPIRSSLTFGSLWHDYQKKKTEDAFTAPGCGFVTESLSTNLQSEWINNHLEYFEDEVGTKFKFLAILAKAHPDY